MLQRIQTVFLAIAAIASILLFFFPLANYYSDVNGNYKLFIYGIRCMDPEPRVAFSAYFTLPLVFLNLFSLIFSVAAVFNYRNRFLQMRIGAFNLITNIVLLMVIFFFYATRIQGMTQIEPDYRYLGMSLPLVAILCLVLANRFIKKDEKLVKSADRLR
jgi:hypothetical protein